MLIQVGLIATTAKFMFGYGWGWTESLLFGGILSATDPVAVIALLKVRDGLLRLICSRCTSDLTAWFRLALVQLDRHQARRQIFFAS